MEVLHGRQSSKQSMGLGFNVPTLKFIRYMPTKHQHLRELDEVTSLVGFADPGHALVTGQLSLTSIPHNVSLVIMLEFEASNQF